MAFPINKGKSLPKLHFQMRNWEKAVSVEASALTGAEHRHSLHRRQQSDNRRMAVLLQSITPAHFPASGTQRDIWHTYLPNRKQAAVAAHCLRAAEPEVSKTLKQRNHHNNCWLMNMRTKQQAKDWFVTVSKGAQEMQWVLHTQQAPGFVLKARNPGQTTQMFWWKSWWERVNEWNLWSIISLDILLLKNTWKNPKKAKTKQTTPQKNHFPSLKGLNSLIRFD